MKRQLDTLDLSALPTLPYHWRWQGRELVASQELIDAWERNGQMALVTALLRAFPPCNNS